MANQRSPWKEVKTNISKLLGTENSKGNEKRPAFPNKYFKSPTEYVEFAKKHNVYGEAAKKLKKELDREIIPIPKITPKKR